jgi:hypothetical protein
MRKPSTPIKVKTKRTYSQKPDPRPKPTVRPKPTGPDYEGPYSRSGTAGPVNETVSKVRDILRDDNGLPIPYRKKGGTMKKTVKKVVAKAPVKKTVAKKPMMKSGGAKKPLRKAQDGKTVQQMTDTEKKAYSDMVLNSQNKEYIQAGEKGYFANKDGRVSMVDYAGRAQPFYTKTIDTTGLAKGAKNFEVEKDLDRGKGYNPSYTPITKTAALKAINNWKNQTNREKVAANKKKVEENKQKVWSNANKVAVNAAKYEKDGGATKATYKKGGTVKSKAKKMADGGPTGIQKVRRNILTKRIDNLNQKGNQNLNSGNKEKAFNQFDKADKLQQRRSDVRQKAGYKKGGLIKSKKK